MQTIHFIDCIVIFSNEEVREETLKILPTINGLLSSNKMITL